jgi:hypothetical protein
VELPHFVIEAKDGHFGKHELLDGIHWLPGNRVHYLGLKGEHTLYIGSLVVVTFQLLYIPPPLSNSYLSP